MSTAAANVLPRAETFLAAHARLLERRLYDVAFRGGAPVSVVKAVANYRNRDGGFGHALEPDVRVSSSQPLFAHFALACLSGTSLPERVASEGVCESLAAVAREDGAIPYLLPDAMDAPRAGHWNGDFALAPSLHATAGVAGALHARGVEHPWLDRATEYVLEQVRGEPGYSGHTLLNVLSVLQHMPDRDRAASLWPRVTDRLFEADYVCMDTPVVSYGLTPLQFAPTPASPLRTQFEAEVIERHLDDLLARQQEDGGWPLTWTPPSGAAASEWRGVRTLELIRVLRAYGRL